MVEIGTSKPIINGSPQNPIEIFDLILTNQIIKIIKIRNPKRDFPMKR